MNHHEHASEYKSGRSLSLRVGNVWIRSDALEFEDKELEMSYKILFS